MGLLAPARPPHRRQAGRAREAGRGRRSRPRPRSRPQPHAAPAAAAAAKPAEAAKPAAAAAAAAAKPAEPKLGAQLIGKLEGPTLVTDPAQFPKAFKEAPSSPSWSRPASCRRSSSASARTRWCSSPCTRSASTAAPGAAASPARATSGTASVTPAGRQPAVLGLHRHEDRAEHRQGLGGPGRRQDRPCPASARA